MSLAKPGAPLKVLGQVHPVQRMTLPFAAFLPTVPIGNFATTTPGLEPLGWSLERSC